MNAFARRAKELSTSGQRQDLNGTATRTCFDGKVRIRKRVFAVAWAVTFAVFVATAIVAHLLRTRGLGVVANWAQILSVATGLVPSATVLIHRFVKGGSGTGPADAEELEKARRALADMVREQWRDEILIRQLDDPAPLAVRWRLTELDVMDHPRHISANRRLRDLLPQSRLVFVGRTDRIDKIAERFQRLPRRRLIILGAPGMGKTTLAVLLLRELLNRHSENRGVVPVLFSLSSWAPGKERLQDWMIRQLAEIYPGLSAAAFGSNAPRRLLLGSHILPILDGLNELPADARPTALTMINASHTMTDPYILTCRTEEYETAVTAFDGDVLTGAAVIEPDPISRKDAVRYLRGCLPPIRGPAWSEVLTRIEAGTAPALVAALDSPLNLWLLRKVYIDQMGDPRILLDRERYANAASIVGVLYDRLLPALITAEPRRSRNADAAPLPRHSWSPRRAEHWLSSLAVHLDRLQTKDIAWWQLRDAIPIHQLGLLVLGLGVIGGISTAFTVRIGLNLATAPSIGLACGISGGFILAFFAAHFVADLSFAAKVFRLVQIGLIVVPVTTAMVWVLTGPAVTASFGLALSLGFGAGSEAPDGPRDPSYANFRLRGRTTALLIHLVHSVPYGLTAGSVLSVVVASLFTIERGIDYALPAAIRFGLTSGIGLGLAAGVTNWATTPLTVDRPQTPATSLRRDIALVVVRAVAFGLVLGVAFGTVSGPGAGLVSGILVAGTGALTGAPVYRACGMYLLTIVVLRQRRTAPMRLMRFLGDAHQLGILRRVGAVYQFRHARMQDHFAQRFVQGEEIR